MDRKAGARFDPERLFVLGALGAAIGFTLVAIRAELLVQAAPLNDEVMHTLLVRATGDALAHGQDPTDFWLPGIALGYPLAHHYQHLAYLVTALIARAAGALFGASSDGVVDACRYVLLSCFPLSVYWAGRRFGFDRPVAACSALASAFFSTDGLFGFDLGSYVWRGFGLYTQLWGMLLLPPAVAQAHKALRTGEGYLAGAVLLGATLLAHLVSGYIACASVALLWVAIPAEVGAGSGQRARFARLVVRTRRLALLFALVALLTAYFFVPFFRDGDYLARSVWEDRSKYDAYGAAVTLRRLVSGELFDFGRVPVLTLGLGAGLAVCLRHIRDARHRIPVVIFGAWLLAYFGRPTWGALINLLPGSGDLQLHRLSAGVHLGGLYLIGHGLALLWRRIGSARRARDWLVPVALTLVLLAPAARERWTYAAKNAEWKSRSAQQLAAEARDLDALYRTLREQPPGRVYAGLAGGWGARYHVGGVPVFGLLAQHGFDVVGRLYHALSLVGDVQVLFDDNRREQYDLFDVRYVVTDTSTQVPYEYKPLGVFGRHRLSAITTGGYFAVVRPDLVFGGAPRDFHPAASAWFRSVLAADHRHPRVVLGHGAALAGTLPLATAASLFAPARAGHEPPRGHVVSETAGLGEYAVRVRMDQGGIVMLKAGYHPGWRALVDNRAQPTVLLLPGYVGVEVPPGEHVVRFRYRASASRHALQLVSLAVLAFALVAGVRAHRRRPPRTGASDTDASQAENASATPATSDARPTSTASTAGTVSTASADRVAVTLAITFAAFYAAIGPGNFFSIDEVDVQETAQSVVQRGTLDIPATSMTRAGRGDAHYDVHRGPALGFVALPFVALGTRLDDAIGSPAGSPAAGPAIGTAEHPMRWGGRLAIFAALLVNACLGGALAAMIFLAALRLGGDRRVALLLAAIAGLATPLLGEATHFFQHPLEALGLLYAFWFLGEADRDHDHAASDASAAAASSPRPSRRLPTRTLLGGLALAVAMLARPNAAAGAVPLWLYGLAIAWRATSRDAAATAVAHARRARTRAFAVRALAMSVGPVLTIVATLLFHWLRFDPAQHFAQLAQGEAFTLDAGHMFRFVAAYLASPALSVFLFAPPLLLALAGAPAFVRRWPLEAAALFATGAGYALLYSMFGRWDGGLSYGPRYLFAPMLMLLLFALPVLARVFPAAPAMPGAPTVGRARAWRTFLLAAVALGFAVQGLGVLVNVGVNQWSLEGMGLQEGEQVFVPALSPPWLHLQALARGEHLAPWMLRAFAAPGPALLWWLALAVVIAVGTRRLLAELRAAAAPAPPASDAQLRDTHTPAHARFPAFVVSALVALVAFGFTRVHPLRMDATQHARRLAGMARDAEARGDAVMASELHTLVVSMERWSGARPQAKRTSAAANSAMP